jgi:dTDP-4-amino-4,6-dideoxygalactose transaminase
VFVDVRPETYTIDPDKTLASISSRTKAVIPIHIFGQAVEIDRLVTIARTYSVAVVEDVRYAFGGRIGSRRLGTYGEFGAYSFAPTAPLGSLGDGGALTTNNEERAALVRKLRDQGRANEYDCEVVGYNSRLDAIQAAFLSRKLSDVDENNSECIENARLYNHLLAGSTVKTPIFYEDGQAVYNQYVVRAPERDKLIETFNEKGIGWSAPIARPLHLQPAFAYLGYKEGAFPIAEELAREAIALPVRPGLKKREIETICETISVHYGVTA